MAILAGERRAKDGAAGLRHQGWFASAAAAFLLAACGHTQSSTTSSAGSSSQSLTLLHATRGSTPGIYDADNRQVILRGVNYGALGDYYIDNPANPAPVAPRENDFPEMARIGLNS